MKLDGTKWVQAYPKKLGTFDCSLQVRRRQHRLGHRHHPQRPGLRHAVRHVLGHQAPGMSARHADRPPADLSERELRPCTCSSTYTILGLVTGAVYGIAASGLVLTYTTSGIFNFAQGAMAMLAAFTYWQFRYGWNWPAPLALFAVHRRPGPAAGA